MIREWWPGALAIVVAGMNPLFVAWAEGKQWSAFDQWLLGIVVIVIALYGHWLGASWHEVKAAQREKRRRIQAVLEGVAEDATKGDHALDSTGDLNIRMNLMLPYRKTRMGARIAYDCPGVEPIREDVVLHFWAATQNSKGRPSLWMGWHCGQGAVGRLWAEGQHVSVTPLPDTMADVQEQYGMTDDQAKKTQDTRCIISVAVVDDIGRGLRRKGILNVSSSNPLAIDEWLPNGHVNMSAIQYVVGVADEIVQQGLLPK